MESLIIYLFSEKTKFVPPYCEPCNVSVSKLLFCMNMIGESRKYYIDLKKKKKMLPILVSMVRQ